MKSAKKTTVKYVKIGDRFLQIGTPESTVYAQQEMREEGIECAPVWEAPQASFADAIEENFKGAKQTASVLKCWGR